MLEGICAFFGIYGIGWLYRKNIVVGIVLLALGLGWFLFVLLLTIFTAGFLLLCLVPLHIIFIVVDVIMLSKARPAGAYPM